MRTIILTFFLSFLSIANNAQQLSELSEVSVLTIGPGTSLNDSFGHNAFRIKDEINQIDYVFNYGVYDFNTPNFYGKFAQGKLNYLLGLDHFEDFYKGYTLQNRTIKEQILNLNQKQKQQIFDFLIYNYKPENRAYLYDFFYDNCATKIRDVIKHVLKGQITFNTPEDFESKTFRSLIHGNLNTNSWGSLGIDLALGSVIDKHATPEEHMFLPKYIFTFFENATIDNKTSLVKKSQVLFHKAEQPIASSFLTSPLMLLGSISLLIIFITYNDYKKENRTIWLDTVLFLTTGLIGIVIMLLWLATDHTATAQNYNLLWAFAANILLVTQVRKEQPRPWFVKYMKFLIIALSLLTLHWVVGVQVFALGLLPLLISLLTRYLYIVFYYSRKTNI